MACCCFDRDQSWTENLNVSVCFSGGNSGVPDISVCWQVETVVYLMLVFVFQVETMVYRADTTSSRLFKILREKISQVTCPPVLTLEEEHGVVVVLC